MEHLAAKETLEISPPESVKTKTEQKGEKIMCLFCAESVIRRSFAKMFATTTLYSDNKHLYSYQWAKRKPTKMYTAFRRSQMWEEDLRLGSHAASEQRLVKLI